MIHDIIIVGAGPAGLMAAGVCAGNGLQTLVLDKNRCTGRKLRITGKGRCNVTNNCAPQQVIAATVQNGKFLYSAANKFTPQDAMQYFENIGVSLKTERGNRVFPVSDDANEIADAMECQAKSYGAQFLKETTVSAVKRPGTGGFILNTNKGIFQAKSVLLACGGASYPGTGSNGDGAKLAKTLGHSVTPLRPSLAPLVEAGSACKQMQGLSLRNCGLKILNNITGVCVYEDFGELLFTHFGLSGPVILSASAHIKDMEQGAKYTACIDLKPALDEKKLDARLLRDFAEYKNRIFENILDKLLPQKLIPVVVARSGVAPDTRCNAITRQQRQMLLRVLKCFQIPLAGVRPISEAIITRGGVAVSEVQPKTMESRLRPGLFFAGEILDVDAYTGGFNLQIAFSTAYLAGHAICEKIWNENNELE